MKLIPVVSYPAAIAALAGLAALVVVGQIAPPTGKTTGPGLQAPQDSREADVLKTCKNPPRAGAPKGGGGAPKGAPKGPAPTFPREYTVSAIPGVIAAGAHWTEVWTVEGNNGDGFVADKDGNLLLAQNDNSQVVKLDLKTGKATPVYTGLNTSGSLAMSSKGGALYVANRGLNPSIERLAPKKGVLANKYMGDPLDCIGSVLNDMAADSKGGVYFTYGGLFYANSKGVVTRYGENLATNGVILSPDEKHVYVTNQGTLAAFDVQPDGSLTNQHEFARWEGGGGDGSAFDSEGRLYVTATAGIQVISPEGKVLGTIPTPRGVITTTFGGKDRKTLYAVARTGNTDWVIGIPMLAKGPKGRAK